MKLLFMDYEKKYEKLVDAIKALRDNNPSDEGIHNWVNDNVPELKESEDERIRKTLIEHLNAYPKDYYCELKTSCIIAWLKKQGESDETKAKTFLINKGYPIDTNGKFPTYEEMYDIIKEGLEKQCKQNPVWSEEDEETLGWLCTFLKEYGHEFYYGNEDNVVDWLKSLKERIKGE